MLQFIIFSKNFTMVNFEFVSFSVPAAFLGRSLVEGGFRGARARRVQLEGAPSGEAAIPCTNRLGEGMSHHSHPSIKNYHENTVQKSLRLLVSAPSKILDLSFTIIFKIKLQSVFIIHYTSLCDPCIIYISLIIAL